MRIAIGADHGGYYLKEEIRQSLEKAGHTVQDFGCYSTESVDYPDYALPVARAIQQNAADKGILVCGTGIGMSIAANKQVGIRAALCHDLFSAQATREHNDSNLLCMGARVIGSGLALSIVDTWLNTEFSGGRHVRRIAKLEPAVSKTTEVEFTSEQLQLQAADLMHELVEQSNLKAGSLVVIGCSTSEIGGHRIGSASSAETAAAVYAGLRKAASDHQLVLAFQCCEHLNRSLVVERSTMERYDLEQVSVVPAPHAGGAMATRAFSEIVDAVVVNDLRHKARAGLDIGDTMIGMHLAWVAVPLRLAHKTLGKANVHAAFSRPRLVGGKRAVYSTEQAQETNRV